MDLAVVGVAAVICEDKGHIDQIRIGLGAVAPTPIRAEGAERLLKETKPGVKEISNAARAAAQESRPIDDHRASAEYRKMMVEVLVRRALNSIVS
jgi:carbon-monoxide dehydrogenase medium subunit